MSDDTPDKPTGFDPKRGIARFLTAQKALVNIAAQQNAMVGGILRGQIDAKNAKAGSLFGAAQQAAGAFMETQQRLLDKGLSLVADVPEEDTNLDVATARTRAALQEAMDVHRTLLEAAQHQSRALTGLADRVEQGDDPKAANIVHGAQTSLNAFIDAQQTFLNSAASQAERGMGAAAPEVDASTLRTRAEAAIDKFSAAQRRIVALADSYGDPGDDSADPKGASGIGPMAQKGVDRFIDAQHALLNLAQLALYAPSDDS